MNEYITFHKVLDLLQAFQENSPILNTFGYGNLVDFDKNVSGTTVEYPYLFVVPQSIQYAENTTTYQVSMLFTDILDTTRYNEKDIVSDMSLEARRFLSYLKRGLHTFPELYNNLDVDLPANAIPFLERMGDHVAGVALDVNLIIFEDLNACDYFSCQNQIDIVSEFPNIVATGKYARQYTYTGGSINYGYLDAPGLGNYVGPVGGIYPNGKKYPIFQAATIEGGLYRYYTFARFYDSINNTDLGWGVVKTTNSSVLDGQTTNNGYVYNYNIPTLDGGIRYPIEGTYLNPFPTTEITLTYPDLCPPVPSPNPSPTPSITPSPTQTLTPTPTITPTITPTPTDPTLCANYLLSSNFTTQYSFITCGGIPSGTTLNSQFNIPVCAKEGSMSVVSGSGSFVQSGYC